MTTVTCAIIENNDKILIARRAKGQKLPGKWEFPGGKVEEGESPEECLKRELEEEFGGQGGQARNLSIPDMVSCFCI